MSDLFAVKIDLPLLLSHRSASEGRTLSEAEVRQWLNDEGFIEKDDHWIVESVDLASLDPSEILESRSLFDPKPVHLTEEEFETARKPYQWIYPKQPELSAEERQHLRDMPDYELCTVPKFLFGTHRDAKAKLRSVLKKIHKAMMARKDAQAGALWQDGMKDVEFIHVDDAPREFVSWHARGFTPHGILLYLVPSELREVGYKQSSTRDDWYRFFRSLILDGTNYFWFTLAFVDNRHHPWLPRMDPDPRKDLCGYAKEIVQRILHWWPHIAARHNRFVISSGEQYKFWGMPNEIYSYLGIPELRKEETAKQFGQLDAIGRMDHVRKWLSEKHDDGTAGR